MGSSEPTNTFELLLGKTIVDVVIEGVNSVALITSDSRKLVTDISND